MEECLITNKICPVSNKKCKECKLDSCKEVLEMIRIQEERKDKKEREKLEKELPKECQGCSILQIINLNKHKVYCPYRIKERCILK